MENQTKTENLVEIEPSTSKSPLANRCNKRALTAGLAAFLSAGATFAVFALNGQFTTAPGSLVPVSAAHEAETQTKDPFELHTWHAVGKTWPGTLEFDEATKTVILTPMGSNPIQANYTFEITNASDKDLGKSKLIEGTLRMTNTVGQVSISTFKITDGNRLNLSYASGQSPEEFQRLSPGQAASQKEMLEKMLREGKIQPIAPPSL